MECVAVRVDASLLHLRFRNLGYFGSILKPFSFIQYYGSFTLIGYYCFILMYKGVTPLTVVYIAFIVFLVVESFLFCRILSQINDLVSETLL